MAFYNFFQWLFVFCSAVCICWALVVRRFARCARVYISVTNKSRREREKNGKIYKHITYSIPVLMFFFITLGCFFFIHLFKRTLFVASNTFVTYFFLFFFASSRSFIWITCAKSMKYKTQKKKQQQISYIYNDIRSKISGSNHNIKQIPATTTTTTAKNCRRSTWWKPWLRCAINK